VIADRRWTLTDEIARHFPHRDLVPPFRDKAVRYDGRFAGGDVIQLTVGFRKTRGASEEIHHLIPGVPKPELQDRRRGAAVHQKGPPVGGSVG
jgi:hypothetical protein